MDGACWHTSSWCALSAVHQLLIESEAASCDAMNPARACTLCIIGLVPPQTTSQVALPLPHGALSLRALHAGEILEVQAASNNTIKGGLTAEDEPADKQGLVTACTGGLLHASGQASSPALQAGVSISAADAAANFSGTPQGEAPTISTGRIHEGPPCPVEPHGLSVGVAGGQGGAQMLRMYQPADVEEFQVGEQQSL